MLAKAADQAMTRLNVSALSLASQLPQVFGVPATFANTLAPRGSWLASDGGLTDDYNPRALPGKKTRNDSRTIQSEFRYHTSMEVHR
ncbi:hypothetical protein CQ009_21710 [Pseudomonas sp. MYb2]|nr:hypothetical protein CQ025_22485 [Pseudomonas sp. MYb3]PRC31735.1 hypothetical protein CQ009_21710 [Pseudomonas sp. MYb2]